MRTVCVQFQPKRARGVSVEVVTQLMARTAKSAGIVRTFGVEVAPSRQPWVNYFFTARYAGPVWAHLRRRALHHRRLGSALRESTIVTCEGSRGWDNYRLLHHFDPAQAVD